MSNCPKSDWEEISKAEADIISKKNNDAIKAMISNIELEMKPIIEYEAKIQSELRDMVKERIAIKEIK